MTITVPRTDKEVLTDRLLLMRSVEQSQNKGWIGSTKIQKIIFYSEYLMNENNDRGFNLLFRRHNFGPYSDDLDADIKELAALNYLSIDERGSYCVGELGIRVFKEINTLFADITSALMDQIDFSIDKIAPLSTDETLKFVYDLPYKSLFGKTVRDVPDGGTICKPIDGNIAKNILEFNEEWLETISLLLDVNAVTDLYSSIDDPHTSPPIPYMVDR